MAHLFSVLVLYQLSLTICLMQPSKEALSTAILAASLHIISPGGLFLSAPYAESSFSFLNMTGFYLYAKSRRADYTSRSNTRDCLLVVSGIVFGLATTLRSNGLLSGLIFCYDLFEPTAKILQLRDVLSNIRRLFFLGLSGCGLATGFVLPQYLAYIEYCANAKEGNQRPWCTYHPPSVYTWVQRHYW